MNQSLLSAVYASLQAHAVSATQTTDVFAYCDALASDLAKRTDVLNTHVVVRDLNQRQPHSIVISKRPFAAITFQTTTEDGQTQPLLEMWGDAAGGQWLAAQMQRIGELVEQLSSIVEELWSTPGADANQALNRVCRRVVAAMPNIDRVSVVMNNEAANMGAVTAAFPTDTIGQSIKLEDYEIHSRLKSTRAPLRIDDTQMSGDLLGPNTAILAAFAVKSILIIPFFQDGQFVGSVGFDAINRPHQFSDEEIRLLETVVRQMALFNERHRGTSDESVPLGDVQQQFVNELVQAVPLRTDVESLLKTTAETVGHLMGATSVGIYLGPNLQKASNQETE